MNICLLAAASSIHTVRWVNALIYRGHRVSLITMHSAEVNKIKSDVNIYNLKFKAPYGYYLNVIETRKLLKKIKPDIINAHYASGYGTLARLIDYKPLLVSVWGSDVYDFPYQSQRKKAIIQRNLNKATQIASTSKVMKHQTLKLVNPNKTIEVTPFGIDTNIFYPKRKESKSTITIGTVKTLEEKYGIRYLLESINLLKKTLITYNKSEIVSKLEVLIVGKGSKQDELKVLSKELLIDDIVQFVGYVSHNNVPKYLNRMDIYCAPSILDSESFGVAILEASACGIPVIVSNVGGLPEVVNNNDTGYVVDKKNPQQIAEKLYELVIDEELREKVGNSGRKHVLNNYKWEDNVTKMEKLYGTVIEDNEY